LLRQRLPFANRRRIVTALGRFHSDIEVPCRRWSGMRESQNDNCGYESDSHVPPY
jgi:hypothetical protein